MSQSGTQGQVEIASSPEYSVNIVGGRTLRPDRRAAATVTLG